MIEVKISGLEIAAENVIEVQGVLDVLAKNVASIQSVLRSATVVPAETAALGLSERDPSGLPWDARIHGKGQKRNKSDNNWTLQRRSPDKKPEFEILVAQVRAEYALPASGAAVIPDPPPTAGTDLTLDPAAWFKHVNQTNDGVSRFDRIPVECPASLGVKTVVEFTKLDKSNRDSLWAWIQADVDVFRAKCQAQSEEMANA
jgi:hypothetical protein